MDPTVDRAPRSAWARHLALLAGPHRQRVGRSGLVVVLGFLVSVLAIASFAGLAWLVRANAAVGVDLSVLAWMQAHDAPGLETLARVVSALGSEVVAVLLVGLVGYFIYERRYGAAVSLVVTTAGAQLLNDVLKALFARTRPAPVAGYIAAQSFSFPSGHAMVSAAFYLFLAYLAWQTLHGWPRGLVVGGLVLLILAIGVSRVYLGVHYLTDVLAGYSAGGIWTEAVIVGGRLLRPPGAPAASHVPPAPRSAKATHPDVGV